MNCIFLSRGEMRRTKLSMNGVLRMHLDERGATTTYTTSTVKSLIMVRQFVVSTKEIPIGCTQARVLLGDNVSSTRTRKILRAYEAGSSAIVKNRDGW